MIQTSTAKGGKKMLTRKQLAFFETLKKLADENGRLEVKGGFAGLMAPTGTKRGACWKMLKKLMELKVLHQEQKERGDTTIYVVSSFNARESSFLFSLKEEIQERRKEILLLEEKLEGEKRQLANIVGELQKILKELEGGD